MDARRLAALLDPFAPVKPLQLEQISIYIDLLLRWNARVNLTAVRDPKQIATRHFGESLFAARHLLPCGAFPSGADTPVRVAPAPGPDLSPSQPASSPGRVLDLGSGAGFPGIPINIWSPETLVTLIESNHKKAAFLREVIRALTLTSIDVFTGRAEDYPSATAALVTLRAVEHFTSILPTAAGLVAPRGRLALLIGDSQLPTAQTALPNLSWTSPIPIPKSQSRIILISNPEPEV
jgi:16S rRNA (guanine527-N7)-methyltransferase